MNTYDIHEKNLPILEELNKINPIKHSEYKEKILIKEAKRRGLVYGVRFISPNGEDWDFKVTSNDFHFDAVNNTLSFTQHLGGTVFLFVHGEWAEVIEQSSLEQDIQQLKDKYKQYKFTITIEDNI